MKQTTSLLLLLGAAGYTAWAADVTFASGHNCTGQALYGSKSLPAIACFDISEFEPATSVVLSNLEPDQRVDIFSDGLCQNKTFSTSDDACYSDVPGHMGSFQIVSNTADVTTASKDLVPYGVKLSNYKDLSIMDPNSVDSTLSNFFIAVGITATATAINVFNAVTACTSIDGNNPVSVIGCIGTPIATILSYCAAYFFSQSGRQFSQAVQMQSGNFASTAKRSMVDMANHDYVSSTFNQTKEGHGTHVGYAKRDMGYGEQTSPVYEVSIRDSGKWHMSAFLDEDSGDFVHHIRSAEDSGLSKRSAPYGYDTIRWGSGGFDFHFCLYNQAAGHDGFSDDLDDMYQTAYDQLTCLVTVDQLKSATQIGIDLYNEESTVIGEVEIIPYTGTQTRSPPSCTSTSFPVNQGCIID